MRGRSFYPDEATKVRIIQGLIQLRKDGQFAGIDANMNTVRIQFAVGGYWKLIGWRKAWEMVDTARRVAAGELVEVQLPIRKPVVAERATAAPGRSTRRAKSGQ